MDAGQNVALYSAFSTGSKSLPLKIKTTKNHDEIIYLANAGWHWPAEQ